MNGLLAEGYRGNLDQLSYASVAIDATAGLTP